MSEKKLFLADKHQFSLGENPSFSSKNDVKFNHYFKVKIPVTVPKELALPEVTAFNYNTNSLDVKKVNFNHIKSVRVKQVTDVVKKEVTNADSQADSQPKGNPIPKTTSVPAKSTQGVTLGGNSSNDNTYIAPIRIKQEYNPSGVSTTADRTNTNTPSLKSAPEPEPKVPEYVPPTTTPKEEPETTNPRYTPPKAYPTYQSTQQASKPATQPATQPAAQPAAQPATKPAAQPATKPAAQPAAKPATTTTQPSSTYRPSSTSIPSRRYPSYQNYGTNRAYGSTPYARTP